MKNLVTIAVIALATLVAGTAFASGRRTVVSTRNTPFRPFAGRQTEIRTFNHVGRNQVLVVPHHGRFNAFGTQTFSVNGHVFARDVFGNTILVAPAPHFVPQTLVVPFGH